MNPATAAPNLEPVNQNLRGGAVRALGVLGTIAGAQALSAAFYLERLEPSSRWAWMTASVVLGTGVIAATWAALRTLKTRVTEEGLVVDGLTESMKIRWADVVRLRREPGRIVLDRIGAPPTVISLWCVSRPDELHTALRTLVPNRALQRRDA
jgi:hypothetical protein